MYMIYIYIYHIRPCSDGDPNLNYLLRSGSDEGFVQKIGIKHWYMKIL